MKSRFRFLSLLFRLRKDKHASGPRLLARLLRDEEGSYLLIMTVAMPVFIGFAALATEGALIFYNHRNVQSAADSAAYSAAIAYSIDGSADNAQIHAQAIVASYGFAVGTGNGQANVVATVDTATYVDPTTGAPLKAINVAVTRPQLPILSSIWVHNPFNVSGSAKAVISGGAGGGNGNCILSLASSGSGVQLQGNPAINAPGCGVFSNSTSAGSIDLGGNASITGGSVGAAGSINVGGSANIGPPPNAYTSNDNPVIDPYAGITTPAPGTCINDTVIKNATGTVTLNPGTYCTTNAKKPALDIKNSSVTLNAGTYVFVGPGQLTVDTTSTLKGIGVTLVFTDPSGAAYPKANGQPTAMDISSQATVILQPPTSGATQGMLIIGNSNIPTDTHFNLQAGGTATSCTSTTVTSCIGGVIYLPTADFTWQGGPILTGACTQMIAYRTIMAGNAQFNNSNCDLSGGGGGGGAKPIGNVVTLVK